MIPIEKESYLYLSKEETGMRGVHTVVNDIRRKVFTEVARMSFEGGDYGETLRRSE